MNENEGAAATGTDETTPTSTPVPATEQGSEQTTQPVDVDIKAENAKAHAEFLKSIGVESDDALKEIIESQKKAKEANQTELEKAQEKLQSQTDLLTQAQSSLKSEQAKVAALSAGVTAEHLNDAVALASLEDGKSIEEQLKSVIARNPGFIKATTNSDGTSQLDNDIVNRATKVSQNEFDKMTYSERVKLANSDPKLYAELAKKK